MYILKTFKEAPCFAKEFLFSLFKVTKSHKKAMSKVRTIVCCCKYYQNDFRY